MARDVSMKASAARQEEHGVAKEGREPTTFRFPPESREQRPLKPARCLAVRTCAGPDRKQLR